jgi:hypothetical protein
VVAFTASWSFAPIEPGEYWSPEDDVYQFGLLALTLLSGVEIDNRATRLHVDELTSRRFGLPQVIKATLYKKPSWPKSAGELLARIPSTRDYSRQLRHERWERCDRRIRPD